MQNQGFAMLHSRNLNKFERVINFNKLQKPLPQKAIQYGNSSNCVCMSVYTHACMLTEETRLEAHMEAQ